MIFIDSIAKGTILSHLSMGFSSEVLSSAHSAVLISYSHICNGDLPAKFCYIKSYLWHLFKYRVSPKMYTHTFIKMFIKILFSVY